MRPIWFAILEVHKQAKDLTLERCQVIEIEQIFGSRLPFCKASQTVILGSSSYWVAAWASDGVLTVFT